MEVDDSPQPLSPRAATSFSVLPADVVAAVFSRLSPQSLAIAACVSRSWRAQAADQPWRAHYAALWAAGGAGGGAAAASSADLAAPLSQHGWQVRYGQRQLLARCWMGRPSSDKLRTGAGTATKACCLLPELGLLFSGGVDRTVRAWDLHSGIQLAASRRHGGTVRCLAADATLLASGSSDHAVRVWQRAANGGSGSGGGGGSLPFDLAGERAVLAGHTGPVSALALTSQLIVSASWDCSVRCWDRASLACVAAVQTDDWVYGLALRGGLLAAACRSEVLLFSLASGAPHRLGALACPTSADMASAATAATAGGGDAPGAVSAVECTEDGRNVFLGTHDGGVWLAEVRGSDRSSSGAAAEAGRAARPVLLRQAAAEVSALSWCYPWLAVADLSGTVLLLDVGSTTVAGAAATEGRCLGGRGKGCGRRRAEFASRLLLSAGMGGAGSAAQCVAMSGSWAAAGLDCGAVLSWDGSKGLQQQAAAAAAREHKAQRRQRNQERQAAQADRLSGGRRSSQPVAVPRPSSRAHQQQQQQQQQQPVAPQAGQSPSGRSLLGRSPAGRARVPPPLHPDALASSAGCRQQAFQVLGSVARPGDGGSGDGGGGTPASGGPASCRESM